jgi:thymidylate kinase/CYTH domain-containing protein
MLKVCLTGGPSTGKTSVINSINNYFSNLGYNVIIVPETATSFIASGIRPFGNNSINPIDFQKLVLENQIKNEEIADKAAKLLGDNSIIICDRGTLDGIAYVTESEWNEVLNSESLVDRDLLMNYDAILYMVSKPELFTKENNASRYEQNANEAIEKGKKVLKSYLSHDNLRVIQPREDIKDKENEVINIIANMLCLPTRIRNQKKYLVGNINVGAIASIAVKTQIKQDYIISDDLLEHRLRKVTQNNATSYHYSIIKKCNEGKREILKDEVISESNYNNILSIQSGNLVSINKTRYSFVYQDQYFKLDIFENGLSLLEVNLTKENPIVTIPEFISVIDDVTNNDEYKNINIARKLVEFGEKRENNCDRGYGLFRQRNTI